VQVDDCLVIGMPLCDESLMDRLKACQAEGLPGVPRDERLVTCTTWRGPSTS
jgi:hypothetical protein